MKNGDKAHVELALKNILYCVDDPKEQERLLSILREYNDKLPDNAVKDWFQKIFYKTKDNYYSRVDYLIDDILDGKLNGERQKVIYELLEKLKPSVERAEKTFWDKLCDLFRWS